MASSLFSAARPLVLPTITSLLGLTGLGGGLYSFIAPEKVIRGFGLGPPPPKDHTSMHAQAFQRSAIYAYGIRNLASGLTVLGLTAFWQLSYSYQIDPFAAELTSRCLGICLTVGTVVALGDAWIVGQFAKSDGVSEDAKEEAGRASLGHAIVAVPVLATGIALLA